MAGDGQYCSESTKPTLIFVNPSCSELDQNLWISWLVFDRCKNAKNAVIYFELTSKNSSCSALSKVFISCSRIRSRLARSPWWLGAAAFLDIGNPSSVHSWLFEKSMVKWLSRSWDVLPKLDSDWKLTIKNCNWLQNRCVSEEYC